MLIRQGEGICEMFLELPSKSDYPDYYKVIKKPISLEEIQVKLYDYESVQQFSDDIQLMVRNAKTYNEAGSAVYTDAVTIADKFAELISNMENAGSISTKTGGTGEAKELTKFTHKKVGYSVGDYCYLDDGEEESGKPLIAQIHRISQRSGAQPSLYVNWYLRPEQTVHPASRKFYRNEVFKSDQFTDFPASDLAGKCWVQYIKDYVRGAPVGADSKHLYVCESRYIETGKKMDKIKNWKYGQPDAIKDVEPDLVLYKTLLTLEKVGGDFIHCENK